MNPTASHEGHSTKEESQPNPPRLPENGAPVSTENPSESDMMQLVNSKQLSKDDGRTTALYLDKCKNTENMAPSIPASPPSTVGLPVKSNEGTSPDLTSTSTSTPTPLCLPAPPHLNSSNAVSAPSTKALSAVPLSKRYIFSKQEIINLAKRNCDVPGFLAKFSKAQLCEFYQKEAGNFLPSKHRKLVIIQKIVTDIIFPEIEENVLNRAYIESMLLPKSLLKPNPKQRSNSTSNILQSSSSFNMVLHPGVTGPSMEPPLAQTLDSNTSNFNREMSSNEQPNSDVCTSKELKLIDGNSNDKSNLNVQAQTLEKVNKDENARKDTTEVLKVGKKSENMGKPNNEHTLSIISLPNAILIKNLDYNPQVSNRYVEKNGMRDGCKEGFKNEKERRIEIEKTSANNNLTGNVEKLLKYFIEKEEQRRKNENPDLVLDQYEGLDVNTESEFRSMDKEKDEGKLECLNTPNNLSVKADDNAVVNSNEETKEGCGGETENEKSMTLNQEFHQEKSQTYVAPTSNRKDKATIPEDSIHPDNLEVRNPPEKDLNLGSNCKEMHPEFQENNDGFFNFEDVFKKVDNEEKFAIQKLQYKNDDTITLNVDTEDASIEEKKFIDEYQSDIGITSDEELNDDSEHCLCHFCNLVLDLSDGTSSWISCSYPFCNASSHILCALEHQMITPIEKNFVSSTNEIPASANPDEAFHQIQLAATLNSNGHSNINGRKDNGSEFCCVSESLLKPFDSNKFATHGDDSNGKNTNCTMVYVNSSARNKVNDKIVTNDPHSDLNSKNLESNEFPDSKNRVIENNTATSVSSAIVHKEEVVPSDDIEKKQAEDDDEEKKNDWIDTDEKETSSSTPNQMLTNFKQSECDSIDDQPRAASKRKSDSLTEKIRKKKKPNGFNSEFNKWENGQNFTNVSSQFVEYRITELVGEYHCQQCGTSMNLFQKWIQILISAFYTNCVHLFKEKIEFAQKLIFWPKLKNGVLAQPDLAMRSFQEILSLMKNFHLEEDESDVNVLPLGIQSKEILFTIISKFSDEILKIDAENIGAVDSEIVQSYAKRYKASKKTKKSLALLSIRKNCEVCKRSEKSLTCESLNCQKKFHFYCAGVIEIPFGLWICYKCKYKMRQEIESSELDHTFPYIQQILFSNVSSNSLTMHWKLPDTETNFRIFISGFKIWYKILEKKNFYPPLLLPENVFSLNFFGLKENSFYIFQICCVDKFGNEGKKSLEFSCKTISVKSLEAPIEYEKEMSKRGRNKRKHSKVLLNPKHHLKKHQKSFLKTSDSKGNPAANPSNSLTEKKMKSQGDHQSNHSNSDSTSNSISQLSHPSENDTVSESISTQSRKKNKTHHSTQNTTEGPTQGELDPKKNEANGKGHGNVSPSDSETETDVEFEIMKVGTERFKKNQNSRNYGDTTKCDENPVEPPN